MVYSNLNLIAALVYSDPPNSSWLLFVVYRPCKSSKKMNFWRMIKNMVLSFSGSWVIIGDLNCIKRMDEKRGGRSTSGSSDNCLKDFMSNTGAIDLGLLGLLSLGLIDVRGWQILRRGWISVFVIKNGNYFSPKPESSTCVI